MQVDKHTGASTTLSSYSSIEIEDILELAKLGVSRL
jgi:hypothetical protein